MFPILGTALHSPLALNAWRSWTLVGLSTADLAEHGQITAAKGKNNRISLTMGDHREDCTGYFVSTLLDFCYSLRTPTTNDLKLGRTVFFFEKGWFTEVARPRDWIWTKDGNMEEYC